MQKYYHNSKKLIKIFTKRRKDIFKNKTNVFYENYDKKIKKNLINKGAISDCSLPLQN